LAHRPSIISTLWSTDGITWHLGEVLGADVLVNPSECALAVMGNDRILISIRNENGTYQRAFAVSEDGISNWKDLHFDSRMSDPICMGSMAHENGTVYHINCDSKTERENLTIKKSTDGFQTYESIFVDTPAGYADLAVKNGTGYVFYERDSNNGGLYFQKIAL
jgi:sialidase-1